MVVGEPELIDGLRDKLAAAGIGRHSTDELRAALRLHGNCERAFAALLDPGWDKGPAKASLRYLGCRMGNESLMTPKAHGTSEYPVPADKLQWGVDPKLADRICNYNRHYAERAGYFETTSFVREGASCERITFFDSNAPHNLLFTIGGEAGRSWSHFLEESIDHGWPSFRDSDVVWEHCRVLNDGEVVSTVGTHLGHNLPDLTGNRFCINLVSIAAAAPAATAQGQ